MTLPLKMRFEKKSLSMGKNVFLKCTPPWRNSKWSLQPVSTRQGWNSSLRCGTHRPNYEKPINADTRDHQMRDRQGFILVYDITNPASVDDLTDLYNQILRNKLVNPAIIPTDTPLIPLVLVGNKLDLAMERKVSHQRGKELAQLWKCPHYETSAKTRTNVDEIFLDLVRQIYVEREEAVRTRMASVSGRSLEGISGEGGVKGEETDGDSFRLGCCVIC